MFFIIQKSFCCKFQASKRKIHFAALNFPPFFFFFIFIFNVVFHYFLQFNTIIFLIFFEYFYSQKLTSFVKY